MLNNLMVNLKKNNHKGPKKKPNLN
jgi:hypothetical protein